MDKKEQTRIRVQRYREKQKSVTQAPENVTQGPDSVTNSTHNVTLKQVEAFQEAQGVTNGVTYTQYPAIIHALVNPEKRKKLEKIYHSLNEFKVADKVYYGCSKDSVPFDVVGDLLEATK